MLVQADATGLEWRILLLLSGDKTGIREVLEGQDIHSNNETELQLPSRLIAKKFLFRTIYRGSGYAFSLDNEFKHVSTDAKFWDKKNAAFYKKYWEVDACHQRWGARVNNHQLLSGPSGREWKIELKKNGDIPWTTLTNYPVQGTGADLMAVARVSLRNHLKSMKLRSLLINTIHDSLIVDAPEAEVNTVVTVMHQSFDDLPRSIKKLWNIESPIPFPCEVKIGNNLGEMKKI